MKYPFSERSPCKFKHLLGFDAIPFIDHYCIDDKKILGKKMKEIEFIFLPKIFLSRMLARQSIVAARNGRPLEGRYGDLVPRKRAYF